LIIALGLTAYSQVINLNGIISLFFIFILFLVACLEAFKNNNGSAKWLNIAVLRWLGNMSYSYYLLHGLALKASFLLLSKVIPPAQQFDALFWIALPVMFICTFIPSFLLFLFVEKPLSINR
jgi:peptidoglycan/LPS O-acetylase OafA/YrhL